MEVTGYEASGFLGTTGNTLGDLIVAEDRTRVWREIQRAVAEDRSFEVEYRIHDAEGGLRWVYDVGRAVRAGDPKDVPVALEGVLFDHTERIGAARKLKSLRRDAAWSVSGEMLGQVPFLGLLFSARNLFNLIRDDRQKERELLELLRQSPGHAEQRERLE